MWPTYVGPFIKLSAEGKRIGEAGHFGLHPHVAKERRYGRHTYNSKSETVAILPSCRQLTFRSASRHDASRQTRCSESDFVRHQEAALKKLGENTNYGAVREAVAMNLIPTRRHGRRGIFVDCVTPPQGIPRNGRWSGNCNTSSAIIAARFAGHSSGCESSWFTSRPSPYMPPSSKWSSHT